MNFFASEETKKIELANGIEIEVLTDISKRTFNSLVKALPEDIDAEKGFTPSQATEFTAGLFTAFVKKWNLDRPATAENYLELKRDAAELIDEALSTHFSSLTPSDKETRKS